MSCAGGADYTDRASSLQTGSETAWLEVMALCSACAAHGRNGRLAWSPAGFLNVCGQLLHRAHKDALWVLSLAEHVLQNSSCQI